MMVRLRLNFAPLTFGKGNNAKQESVRAALSRVPFEGHTFPPNKAVLHIENILKQNSEYVECR